MADPAYIVDGVLTDGEAWVAIASAEPDGSTSPIVFTSTNDGQVGDWSQYMDLVLISYIRTDRGATIDYVKMRPNGNDDAQPTQWFDGYGSAVVASSDSTSRIIIGRATAASVTDTNVFAANICHILDINSGKHKLMLTQHAADYDGAGYAALMAQTYQSQAPITSISMVPYYGTYMLAGSRLDLFGILPRMVA